MAGEYFTIRRDEGLLRLAFGTPATNADIVRDADARLREMSEAGELSGGGLIGLDGPASLPVLVTIVHAVVHRFSAVAVFDPKLDRFVVAASHDPRFTVGSLLARDEFHVGEATAST